MTTQEKIDEIIRRRYDNYTSLHGQRMKVIHNFMRNMPIPLNLKWWQEILLLLGVMKMSENRIMSEEMFLEYLEQCERKNPRPVFKIPVEVYNQIPEDQRQSIPISQRPYIYKTFAQKNE